MVKICTRCGVKKDKCSFQKRAASKDGLTASCKECLSEYDKRRANLPYRVEARKKYVKTESGKVRSSEAKRRYIERNPVKRASHIITGNAIRNGVLVKQPCEICRSKTVHAHHDDYHKPLSVRWLCPEHHKRWHDENGEGLNAS